MSPLLSTADILFSLIADGHKHRAHVVARIAGMVNGIYTRRNHSPAEGDDAAVAPVKRPGYDIVASEDLLTWRPGRGE